MFTRLARDNVRPSLFGIATSEPKRIGSVHVSNVPAAERENYINSVTSKSDEKQ